MYLLLIEKADNANVCHDSDASDYDDVDLYDNILIVIWYVN